MGRKGRDIRKRSRANAAVAQRAAGGAELLAMGLDPGPAVGAGLEALARLQARHDADEARRLLGAVIAAPAAFVDDEALVPFARAVIEQRELAAAYVPRAEPAPSIVFGADIDEGALRQLADATALPVAVSAALMPDAHVGYGLPIGGVLATDGAVIPYAVGVDIACRMRLTVFDRAGLDDRGRARPALQRARARDAVRHRRCVREAARSRRAGRGLDVPPGRRGHPRQGDRRSSARRGSGNHFVELGVLTLEEPALGLPAGRLPRAAHALGLARHGRAGRRSLLEARDGAPPELPKQLRHLAWLALDNADGQEYWAGDGADGPLRRREPRADPPTDARGAGRDVRLEVENHHNFAWKETHGGARGHRPSQGRDPGGRGRARRHPRLDGDARASSSAARATSSLSSASHGAGRVMSRKQATQTFPWAQCDRSWRRAGVTLLSAGLDEVPGVYKDIDSVMAAQTDLVEVLARFDPRS